MNSKIIKFLNDNAICCLSITLPNGVPHSAAMHFAFDSKKSVFIFLTEKDSKKAKPLLVKKGAKASVVVGFNREEMTTMQLDGKAYIPNAKELGSLQKVYFKKFPNRESLKYKPESLFIVFQSSWWRWTSRSKSGNSVIYNK